MSCEEIEAAPIMTPDHCTYNQSFDLGWMMEVIQASESAGCTICARLHGRAAAARSPGALCAAHNGHVLRRGRTCGSIVPPPGRAFRWR